MHHAARVVEPLAVDRHARASRLLEEHHELADGDILVYRFDVGSRNHHVLDPNLAEAEDVVEHRPLFGREGRIAVGIRHERVGKILAQARRAHTA